MKQFNINENGINMVFEVDDQNVFYFKHFGTKEYHDPNLNNESRVDDNFAPQGKKLVEINLSGFNRPHRMGNRYVSTAPGYHMNLKSFQDSKNEMGRELIITLVAPDSGVEVESHIQFYRGLKVVRFQNTVINNGGNLQTLEYISSFNFTGIDRGGSLPYQDKMKVMIPHHGWSREMYWKTYTLAQLGMSNKMLDNAPMSTNYVRVNNIGNWSTKEHLPMSYIENTSTKDGWLIQIEHNGSWQWEIGEQGRELYVSAGGPNETFSGWHQNLNPGDQFITVPVSVAVTEDGYEDAVRTLTQYRRLIRRENDDDKKLSVIFNDYMNCLFGDPTTEVEMPLIDAAAEAGCEYFCIDCGWYADGYWWDGVGDWKESKKRFPGGLRKLTDYIRSKGMVPGLWLELEVMGINCNMAKTMPDSWFFTRHGKRVFDSGRNQLDYRNPDVRAYATSVIDRLVRDYGIGYIKMDYNIEPGVGTEQNADSYGEGLLGHERAYLSWLESIFDKYPDLVIENCSSGGMRMDYAMLSRYSIQSTSDMTDYKTYSTISANAPAALTPEQAAIWSYPLREGDREEVVFNMVNALLLRIHQSGHLAELSPERRDLVAEGITVYKSIREHIRNSLPFWPLGLADYEDEWACLGLQDENTLLLAVWHRGGNEKECALPINIANGKHVKVARIYPSYADEPFTFDSRESKLHVTIQTEYTARLFKIELL